MRINFKAKVRSIIEHSKRVYIKGIGKEAEFEDESKGWFLHLEGSWEAIYVGVTRPDIEKGDTVLISISKLTAEVQGK